MKRPLIIKKPTMLGNLGWPLLIYMMYTLPGYWNFSEEHFIVYCCLEDCEKTQIWRERSLLQFVALNPSWCPEPNRILREQICFLRGLLSLWWRNSAVTGFQRTPAEAKDTGTTLSDHTFKSRLIPEKFLAVWNMEQCEFTFFFSSFFNIIYTSTKNTVVWSAGASE